MVITRSPFRISFFGGSSDYEDFYSKHGSFLIGTTIDKYSYTSSRFRPNILRSENIVSYSEVERFTDVNQLKNPLLREIFKKFNFPKNIDVHLFADIPSRTGLGGSSACCCSMLLGLSHLNKDPFKLIANKKDLTKAAIKIERGILKESGGIQDQIWASYGGFNSIDIFKDGSFSVKPMPLSDDFKEEFQNSMCLIYANQQRDTEDIAASHTNKDKTKILEYAKTAYQLFLKEDIKSIGDLLLHSWKEKKNLSSLITNASLDKIETDLLKSGVRGLKLLGGGGCGFFLCIADVTTICKIKEKFKDSIFEFSFENCGTELIYNRL